MEIPSKITKRKAAALHKKNLKYLTDEILSQQLDALIEAEFIVDDKRDRKVILADVDSTLNYWHKDVKKAFREFLTDKGRIEKALQRGTVCKSKK